MVMYMDALPWACIVFEQLRKVCPNPGTLRRWVNAAFPGRPLLHQHDPVSGKSIFQYPMVQYKSYRGVPLLYGIGDGVEEIRAIYGNIHEAEVRLGPHVIREIVLREGSAKISASEPKQYRFLTPWLAFNRENYIAFRETADWAERKSLLNGILVGNILSIAKPLGIVIDFPLKVRSLVDMTSLQLSRHDLVEHGFLGEFEANIELPPLLGLGRHVSIGYGTVLGEGWDWI
ncbi:MAG: hypothetical protein H5T73_09950 [Actinobacteria bacterium]|nr:hypothetical protein [Actinomycetota bacterium]